VKRNTPLTRSTIPLLLDDIQPPPRPVIIHGDLWSGNVGVNSATAKTVVFDPSSCYAHNEFELGICGMFGGEPSFDLSCSIPLNATAHCIDNCPNCSCPGTHPSDGISLYPPTAQSAS